ncbi:MAG: LemA family protein [Planctomycetes bacterium]|nr:LemA family protein [Planctomycetota bacterium]MCB9884607.1 LemA family protein [Planctomycetota bacterium]
MEYAVVAIAVLAPLVWWIAVYNRLVRLRHTVTESWSDIDVELRRRYELIPNLVETVRGYARHEREVLEKVVALRNQAMHNQGSAAAQAKDENALMAGLRSVFAVAESYPTLRSDANFLALQQELAVTEDRIAAARRFFNGNVRELRNLRQSFPSSVVAGMAGVEEPSFFELDDANERIVPRVRVQDPR